MAEQKRPDFEKEEVTLPDGRRLVYYWFAGTSPRPHPAGEEPEASPPPPTRSP